MLQRFILLSVWPTFFLVSPLSFAEGGLTLEQAIQEAQSKNPDFEKAQAVSQVASWQKWEVLSQNLPKLNFSATHFLKIKYQLIDLNLGGNPASIPVVVPKTVYFLGASWTVFDGFQTIENFRAAASNARAARLEQEQAQFELEQNIRSAFYEAFAAQLLLNVANQNVTTLEDHLKRAKELLQAGQATKFDTLRIQVQLEEAIPEKMQAEDHLAQMRLELARAMGLNSDSRSLEGSLPIPHSGLPEHLELKTSERKDLQATMERARASEMFHWASIEAWMPKLNLIAEKDWYNNHNSSFSDSNQFREAHSFGLSLVWNFFDGGFTLSKQMEAQYREVEASAVARAAMLKASTEFAYWQRKVRYNSALYQARLRAIEAAEESVRLARLGGRSGTRTETDILDAELDLFRARAGLVQAQVDSAEAWLKLELALGRKLEGQD